MSKSKHNGMVPGTVFDKYGCDTVGLMMLCTVGPSSDRNWSGDTSPDIRNMQIKLWKMVHLRDKTLPEMRYNEGLQENRDKLRPERNTHLGHVNYNYSHTRNLAVVIARANSMIAVADKKSQQQSLIAAGDITSPDDSRPAQQDHLPLDSQVIGLLNLN